MSHREVKKCLDEVKKYYPRATKHIQALEVKIYLMRLEDEFKRTE